MGLPLGELENVHGMDGVQVPGTGAPYRLGCPVPAGALRAWPRQEETQVAGCRSSGLGRTERQEGQRPLGGEGVQGRKAPRRERRVNQRATAEQRMCEAGRGLERWRGAGP